MSSTPSPKTPNNAPTDYPGDIPPETLRAALHRTADMVVDYLTSMHQRPVTPSIDPGDIRKQLPASPPDSPEAIDAVLDDYARLIQPNSTHWNHPGFMAYFPVTGSGPGIVGELLAATLNINAMLWRTGPAQTELEEHSCDWLRQALGLPDVFSGHINDTASVSSLISLAAAREKLREYDIRHRGMAGRSDLPPLTVYCSDQAHSSIDKAAITLGIGLDHLRRIESDDQFRLRIDKLEEAIAADKAAGRRPIALVGTLGTTSTTSVDPLTKMAAIAKRENLWLHVDGAYALSAAVCPEYRVETEGLAAADSIVTNPHKWLFVPVDCSVLFVRDPALLRRAFSVIPDYLVTSEMNVTNLMDYGVQLGRRFRALKLWMVMRSFGITGLQDRIRFHCDQARQMATWIQQEPGLEVVAPVPFSTVCFRAIVDGTLDSQNTFNERLLAEINAAGPIFLSHTKLRDRYTLRLTVGNLRTTPEYLDEARNIIRTAHARMRERGTA